MSVSKNQIKLYNSLQQKKYRNETGLFLAEGTKIVLELLQSNFEVIQLYCTAEWASENKAISHFNFEIISLDEIKKISALTNPQPVLALVKQKQLMCFSENELKNRLTLFLDDIRDPGNLGTILRVADWYGIKNVICTTNTVDLYNPKVIQASMGSFLRVNCYYNHLKPLLEYSNQNNISVYASLLKGKNIYNEKLPKEAVLVMGNEANGLSKETINLCSHHITIPSFSVTQNGAESLNVSIATAILISEFKRA